MQKKYYPLTVLFTILFIAIGYLQLDAQIQTLSLKPLASSDDAEQTLSSGSSYLPSSDLDIETGRLIGIRFPNVTLPIGATITNAYIQFTVDASNSGAATTQIKAQIGNASTYTTANSNVSNRTYTSGAVTWTTPQWSTGQRGLGQRTPDLSALITEAMQSNFVSGNALAFSFAGQSNVRVEAESVTGGGTVNGPELIIEYSEQPIERSLLTDILVINEATGSGTVQNGKDWIELYNKSNDAINLDSVFVTDDIDDPYKLMFSQTNINGQAFALVETDLFFGIKAAGETVFLYQTFNGNTLLLDSLPGRPTIYNTSYGRKPDGSTNIADFNTATPGSSNNAAQEFIELQFSQPRGLYTSGFSLTLSAPQGGTIRYTTNSSTPSQTTGTIYNGPIQINDNTIIKAIAYSNVGSSKVITNTYIINSNPAYQEVPVLSLSTTNSLSSQSENDCTVEYIDKYGEGTSAFADAGFRVFGATSTGLGKKSYRFKFRKEYGYSKFDHPIFEQKEDENYAPVKSFNSFDIRSSHDATASGGLGGTNMSSNIAHNYLRQMGNVNVHTRHVHVFMNGSYHGVYTLKEHYSASYAEDYFGGDKTEYDRLDGTSVITSWTDSPSVSDGAIDQWNELKSFATTNFQEIKARLDINHFIDFMMIHFIGGFEWEYRAIAHQGLERTKFRFHHNDFDGFIRQSPSGLADYLGKLNTSSGEGPGKLFYLAGFGGSNLEYKTLVKDRVLTLFNENSPEGVMTVSNFTAKTNEFRDAYRKYNELEYSRWGYSNSGQYEQRVNGYLNYLPTRFQTVKNFLDGRGLMHTYDYVSLSQPAGNILNTQSVTISNPNPGTTVYYTLDGRDVVFDNAVAPWAIAYTPGQNLPLIDGLNTVKARAYSNNNFGPLTEANYNVVSGINITGVGYNIEGDDDLEFLFVSNYNTIDIEVGGDSIVNGITFGFPAGTVIAAGETVMLSRDLTKYPDINLTKYSWSEGKLSNGGEQIVYQSAAGDTINDFTYDDKLPWPIEADGDGAYLQLIANNLDNTIPENWEAINISTLGRTTAVDPDVFQNYGINITGVGYNIKDESGTGDDNLEFLFISNFGEEDRLVEGDSIFKGITFGFPTGTIIAAGETVMLSKDLSKYPDVTMTKYPWDTGKLSNGGEQISYRNLAGDIINDFTYDDNLPWPVEADGDGFYLQLIANDLDNRIPANWEAIAVSTLGNLTSPDEDGDGIPANLDCDDNDPNIPTTPGTTCNDGDDTTENDVIGTDGCTCAGTPIIDNDNDGTPADLDCDDNDPNIPTTPGTTCNDGDDTTENDVIGTDGCTCAGTPIVVIDNDNDGTPADLDCDDNNPNIPTTPGTTCNDGDDTTENDVIGTDGCTCAGTPIVVIDNDNDGTPADLDCDDNNPNIPTTPGTTCNDGDDTTENDVIGTDGCTCAGTPIVVIDNDNDGTPADLDCDDNNPNIPTTPGTTCNDGDDTTENDVIGTDGCTCAGTPIVVIDNDNDGTPADLDCDDNDPNIPTTPGTTCNDGDDTTENDVIGTDGCTCAGTPIQTGCNPTYTISGNTVTLNGLNGAHNAINAYIQPSWADAYSCFDNCDSSFELPDGEYYLHIKIFDASYQVECALQEYITIDGSSACTPGAACNDGDLCTENDAWDADCNCVGTAVVDADNDGLCANEDCDDSDPNIPSTSGTTCDDGDPNTENDVYGSDGCTCAGTPIGACNPTYTISGNTVTVNGLTGAHNSINAYTQPNWADAYSCFDNCDSSFDLPDGQYFLHIKIMDEGYQVECALQEYITIDGSAACNTGSACNDGDLCTENDVWDADCNCIGTPVIDADDDGLCANEDCDDNDPNLPATPGTLCNDGNPTTINDAIQADGCTCAGIDPSGCNITITTGLNEITIDGVNGDHVIIHVFDATWATVFNCLDDCDNPQIVSGLPSGTYYVKATNYDASWSPTCENIDYYTVSGSSNLESSNQEYLFFEADKSGAKVQLNWVTNVDDKTSYYEIERSVDGVSFETIGQVTSRSEMNTATGYDDWDVSPKDGVNFYRINQILEDGTVRNSTVEIVTLDKQFNHFLVYPNPAVDQLNIELNDFIGEAATIQIYNQLGHLMTSRSIESLTADAEVFDLNGYSSGVYAITIRTGNGKRLTKLFVVNK